MSQVLLLYESRSGFTRRYAQWIGEELGVAPIQLNNCRREQIAQADLVIYGAGVSGGIVNGQAKVERMAKKAGGRPVVWFATGLRPHTPRTLDLLRKNNFGRNAEAPLFYFPGGLDRTKLPSGDRTLLLCYRAMLRRRRDLDPEDTQVLQRMSVPGDYTDRTYIAPLVDLVKTMLDTPAVSAAS